jgi:hypothetical protein
MRATRLCVAVAVLSLAFTAAADGGPPVTSDAPGATATALGGGCARIRSTGARTRCYVNVLFRYVERSHDPARALPDLDAQTRAAGGFLAAACHGLMHAVGRKYARRHHVTLATLQRYLPKSNDPGCSAGFGHGLIMELGPQIVRAGPRGALRVCLRLATRMRQYTCVHGLGHAYMRLYGEYLKYALPQCRRLGPRSAADCAQGAFHDYWIATSGRDATKKRPGLVTSPRVLCGARTGTFAMACWYRVFVERPPVHPVRTAADVRGLCSGLRDVQRAGCVAAAALSAAGSDPTALVGLCSGLSRNDAVNCLRAVPVEEVDRWPGKQLALIRSCRTLQDGARRGCYSWFGRALTVVTNGAFRRRCAALHSPAARLQCRIGAARFRLALVTFA